MNIFEALLATVTLITILIVIVVYAWKLFKHILREVL